MDDRWFTADGVVREATWSRSYVVRRQCYANRRMERCGARLLLTLPRHKRRDFERRDTMELAGTPRPGSNRCAHHKGSRASTRCRGVRAHTHLPARKRSDAANATACDTRPTSDSPHRTWPGHRVAVGPTFRMDGRGFQPIATLPTGIRFRPGRRSSRE